MIKAVLPGLRESRPIADYAETAWKRRKENHTMDGTLAGAQPQY